MLFALLWLGPALIVIGLAVLIGSRWTAALRRDIPRYMAIFMLLLGLTMTASCATDIVWVGGYRQAEIELTFTDFEGNPVEGVELRVEDARGNNYYHYPVDDYLPDSVPTSDENGVLTFHHVEVPIELTGRMCYWLWVVRIDKEPTPAFVCRFWLRGSEVYRVPFEDLCDASEQVAIVSRKWPLQILAETRLLPGESAEAWQRRTLMLFDRDANGRLGPEERPAWKSAVNKIDEIATAERHGATGEREISFRLIRRRVTVKPPAITQNGNQASGDNSKY